MRFQLPTVVILVSLLLIGSGLAITNVSIFDQAHAAHNPNLFVSAESSRFGNHMSGPQVIEVVVIDPNISQTSEGKGEPSVTVNGKKLRMVQAVDGNWYGYFASRKHASIADSTVHLSGKGLDFGTFCSSNTDVLGDSVSVSQTVGIAIPVGGSGIGGQDGASSGAPITASCSFESPKTTGIMNVVREPKSVNPGTGTIPIGQIGLRSAQLWPFVQLYDFNVSGNVVVEYKRGGGPQSVTLTFNTADQFSKVDLDRNSYPRKSQIHFTITDLNLNIDPTDQDSWSFGTKPNDPSVYYQLFTENGLSDADGTTGAVNLENSLSTLMFENNGLLRINPAVQSGISDVVAIKDNDHSQTNGDGILAISQVKTNGGTLGPGTQPITITESAPNSGIFSSYDESNDSVLVITPDAQRGTTATISWLKGKSQSIVTGFHNAKLTMDVAKIGNEWNSGEKLPIKLEDQDANKNTRQDEDLDVFDSSVEIIPALKSGSPFTLGKAGAESSTKAKAAFLEEFTLVPDSGKAGVFDLSSTTLGTSATVGKIEAFSDRARIKPDSSADTKALVVDLRTSAKELRQSINNPFDTSTANRFRGINLLNYDIRSIDPSIKNVEVRLLYNPASAGNIVKDSDGTVSSNLKAVLLGKFSSPQKLASLNSTKFGIDPKQLHNILFDKTELPDNTSLGIMFSFTKVNNVGTGTRPVVADFFSFGFKGDGTRTNDRIANQIIRFELEETTKDSIFSGTLEYKRINQLTILDESTYESIRSISNEPRFVIIDDATGKESPRINYNDLGADGVVTTKSVQHEAPAHTGKVTLDTKNFNIGQSVTVTLEDQDLNVNSNTVDVYTVVDPSKFPKDPAVDAVGKQNLGRLSDGTSLGTLLEVLIGGERWVRSDIEFNDKKCTTSPKDTKFGDGLASTGFSLVETSPSSGVFKGSFKIPAEYCSRSQGGKIVSTTGVDIKANYVDFRDTSDQITRTSTTSAIGATTGTVSLDRKSYPIPFGAVKNFFPTSSSSNSITPDDKSIFPVHRTAVTKAGNNKAIDSKTEEIGAKNLLLHIRISDPDFNMSPSGEDTIAQNVQGKSHGPVKVMVNRGASSVLLATAGSDKPKDGVITLGKQVREGVTRELGPIKEVSPESDIFKVSIPVRYTDGPASSICPKTPSEGFTKLIQDKSGVQARFESTPQDGTSYCILQGDVITVEYTDPSDSTGNQRTVTTSASFTLRNGVLNSDKTVYVIGDDAILSIVDPDLDLDSDQAESYSLDLIEWDSRNARVTLGPLGGAATNGGRIFDPEPFALRETGRNSGVFQSVIKIPDQIANKRLERGEKIKLEYLDWSPAGAKFVGEEDEEIKHTIYTSNFGAKVELDRRIYTWTDKVFISIVSPDHNFDSNKIDEIGTTRDDEIRISTRGNKLLPYRLVETGTDTGEFAGEVILSGFRPHDVDGDGDPNDARGITTGGGPTDGFLKASNNDGLTVSFKSSRDTTVTDSALVRWNIGEITWEKSSYRPTEQALIQVIDPDMNLNPETIDNFRINAWSDSDAGGVKVTVTETGKATGIFESSLFFTTTDVSSGKRLRVAEGDTVVAEYRDRTLPRPYSKADQLRIDSSTFIGTLIPPLERVPSANLRLVDGLGDPLDKIKEDVPVQIRADLSNHNTVKQEFAYVVQIKDQNGVVIKLAWITGSLTGGQEMTPSVSWLPASAGKYSVQAFVWDSLKDPEPLSPVQQLEINVLER